MWGKVSLTVSQTHTVTLAVTSGVFVHHVTYRQHHVIHRKVHAQMHIRVIMACLDRSLRVREVMSRDDGMVDMMSLIMTIIVTWHHDT